MVIYKYQLISFFVILSFSCSEEQSGKYILVSCREECDDYNCIWEVDSVIAGDKNDKGKFVYLLNSKKDYQDDSLEYLMVEGILTNSVIREDFTMCGTVYEFKDDTLK